MKFEIDFNYSDKNNNKEFYSFIGAELISKEEFSYYEIELNSFEELETLLNKINLKYKGNDYGYSILMSFNSPCIYLDDKS